MCLLILGLESLQELIDELFLTSIISRCVRWYQRGIFPEEMANTGGGNNQPLDEDHGLPEVWGANNEQRKSNCNIDGNWQKSETSCKRYCVWAIIGMGITKEMG